jgi:hypothetical protein
MGRTSGTAARGKERGQKWPWDASHLAIPALVSDVLYVLYRQSMSFQQ